MAPRKSGNRDSSAGRVGAGEPGGDGHVVRGGVLEGLGGEPLAGGEVDSRTAGRAGGQRALDARAAVGRPGRGSPRRCGARSGRCSFQPLISQVQSRPITPRGHARRNVAQEPFHLFSLF